MATPYATVEVDEVTSTQDEARRWFDEAPSDRPLLLIAARQVRGRGRSGREWWPAPRALASSLAMLEPSGGTRLGLLPMMLGLAVRDAVAECHGVALGLKWPNDLMLGDAKVGGILVEHSSPVVVAGVGVNLWWPDAPAGAAGIERSDPGAAAASRLAHAWVGRFLTNLESGVWDRDAYVAASVTLGRDVSWEPAGSGTVVGIDDDGGLVVHTVSGRVTLRAGEIHHLRSGTSLAPGPPATQESHPE